MNKQLNNKKCLHCQEEIIDQSFEDFCCHGCQTVYNLLHKNGLEKYYQYRDDTPLNPVDNSNEQSLEYLNEFEFLKKFSNLDSDGNLTMTFYLENVHCMACLWLIEKLPEFSQSILSSTLSMADSTCTVTINKDTQFSQVAKLLSDLGYPPHPIKNDEDLKKKRQKEDRKTMIQIGIAGACVGNIMLYSISIYAGAPKYWTDLFNWMIVLFSLPALTYSALPFYQGAKGAIKNKALSIDIPIVFALLVGSVIGLLNIIRGSTEHYFDTLSTLVFLLLFARFILKKSQQKNLIDDKVESFFDLTPIKRISPTKEVVHPKFLHQDDRIIIENNQMLPVDGILKSEFSYFNLSILTGEPLPKKFVKDDEIPSGAINIGGKVEFKVTRTGKDSTFGKIIKEITNSNQKTPLLKLADSVASILFTAVFIISITLIIYFGINGNITEGIKRALALLIITCPCALALGTPLALTMGLKKACQSGILIKDASVIEQINKSKKLFIDKTGTLTTGKYLIEKIELKTQLSSLEELEKITYILESYSKHPLAISICRYFENEKRYVLEKLEEEMKVLDVADIPGKGVKGTILENQYIIRGSKIKKEGSKTIGLYNDKNEEILTIFLSDTIRKDATSSLEKLSKIFSQITILSGDSQDNINSFIKNNNLEVEGIGDLAPQEKSHIINNNPLSIMVGDGANDALALSKALIGISVKGSVEIGLRAANIFITKPGISPIVDFVIISKEILFIIKRNLSFSIIYNIVSTTLALMGHINPLMAAIIMPISSLTVLGSTLYQTKKLRRLKNLT